jgi:hypothetical protein
MRTNIEIDDDLMNLVSLQGKVKWVGDLNKMRTYDKREDLSKK